MQARAGVQAQMAQIGPRVLRRPLGLDGSVVQDRRQALDDSLGGRAYYLARAEIRIPLGSAGNELGSDGLLALLALNSGLSSADLLQALVWDLSRHAGGHEFPDDVSALIFDYRGE